MKKKKKEKKKLKILNKIKNNNLCNNTKKNKLFKEEHQHQFNELNDSESCDSLVEYERRR